MNIAVVTGASSGIGREFASQLDDYGLEEIWLVARSEDKLIELSRWLNTPCKILALDLCKQTCIDAYSAALKESAPNILYLINDSGFGKFGRYHEISHRDAMDMIDLNVKALTLLTLHSIPYMSEGSAIIQMSSAAAFNPLPNFGIYAATKAYIYHFSRALRRELRDLGIAVTTVCPSWVSTNFFDVAQSDCTQNRPKRFWPMADATDIVAKALCDCDKNRAVSVYGLCNKTHRLASKLLPHCLLIKKWMQMQIKK